MKKSVLFTLLLMLTLPTIAQEEHEYQKMNVLRDFDANGFTWFASPLLLAAGNTEKSNAMTIGWGAIGALWGMQRPCITVYVAEKRHTKLFMDSSDYFTIMAFDNGDNILEYMGSKSGRDGDKAKALGLHTAYTANGAPYYTEADLVIECRTMYAAPFDPKGFRSDVPRKMYERFPAGIHSMYIGEVTGAWQK